MCFKIGLRAEKVTNFYPETMSVKSAKGDKALSMDSKNLVFLCREGQDVLFFCLLTAPAVSCSSTQAIIVCNDPPLC